LVFAWFNLIIDKDSNLNRLNMQEVPLSIILHAYQPPYPIQEKWVVDRIIKNCYRPLINKLLDFPNVKIIVNINASLTDMLLTDGSDVLQKMSNAYSTEQLEFLQSCAYHPIMPLLSDDELDIQIRKNQEINQEYIVSNFNPTGFFPPELAIDERIVKYLTDKLFKFMLLPINSIPDVQRDKLTYYKSQNNQMFLFARDKDLSNNIAFNKYNGDVEWAIKEISDKFSIIKRPVLLAMDMETFGEHHEGYYEFLFELLSDSRIKTIHSEEFINKSEKVEVETLTASSWSTDDHDLKNGVNFPLWEHPLNPIHTIQHLHFDLLKTALNQNLNEIDQLSRETQKIVLSAMHSCQFWWASGHGRWSPEMVKKGFKVQQDALERVLNEKGVKDKNLLNLSNKLDKKLDNALKLFK
jgi:hypothetical protein